MTGQEQLRKLMMDKFQLCEDDFIVLLGILLEDIRKNLRPEAMENNRYKTDLVPRLSNLIRTLSDGRPS